MQDPLASRLPVGSGPPIHWHGATRQLAVTIVAPVESGRLTALRRTLNTIGADPAGNDLIPFAALPRTHFARLLVLDAAKDLDDAGIEPKLIYMADVDRGAASDALSEHLGELADVAGSGLDRIFGPCRGYPAHRPSRPRRVAWLRDHAVAAAATYVNTVWRSVHQIRQEARLHDAIAGFVDRLGIDWSRLTAVETRQIIQAFVRSRPELGWALEAPPSPGLGDRLADAVDLLAPAAGLAALAPVLVPALPLFAAALRRQELTDPAPHVKPTHAHVRRLAELEDRGPQNQFSAVGFVKPGLMRRVTIQSVTRAIDYAARHLFNRADLAGVKTIHTARWVFLDDHRRMIFASNYDGSVESYNGDFINIVAQGLNAVFSNGVGYPRTNWLFFGGATREQEFKDYLRRHQVPTQVWYSAYPGLTALNIDNNAYLRAGLLGARSEQEARRWLHRI